MDYKKGITNTIQFELIYPIKQIIWSMNRFMYNYYFIKCSFDYMPKITLTLIKDWRNRGEFESIAQNINLVSLREKNEMKE